MPPAQSDYLHSTGIVWYVCVAANSIPTVGCWEVRYDQVLALGLADRIVEDRESI
ncbi:MAG: hypothetical protein HYZ50_23710 [Deltaproteobacteria bacterium]|nr:hypothetical protein [Deltaproteobacteria bacterium]